MVLVILTGRLLKIISRPDCVPLAFMLPSDVNTFYQYAAQYLLNIWFNLWIKMSTIILTVVIFDLHCQCHTFLADHSAVVQLNKKEPGRGWVTGAKLER